MKKSSVYRNFPRQEVQSGEKSLKEYIIFGVLASLGVIYVMCHIILYLAGGE